MPELPEVETVRRGIEAKVVGRKILSVEVGRERSVRRTGREVVIHGLTGTTVTNARRRGKYLLCDLDSGDEMMIHLRMSGRVLVEPVGTKRPTHTHVVLSLSERDGVSDEMWFVDPRTFGEVVVFDPAYTAQVLPELVRLGVDPICEPFDSAILAGRLKGKRGAIKPLLLSQHVVAGIGNIYRSEILWRQKVHPKTPGNQITRAVFDQLWNDAVLLLEIGVKNNAIITVDGVKKSRSKYGERVNIFGKLVCPACATNIETFSLATRRVFVCASCQPPPA